MTHASDTLEDGGENKVGKLQPVTNERQTDSNEKKPYH